MRKEWIILAVLGLSGCATYAEVQQRAPQYQADTDRAPQDYADCLLPRMVELAAGTHEMKDGGAVVILTPAGNGAANVAGTITATPTPTGSHVALRNAMGGKAERPWQAARSCL